MPLTIPATVDAVIQRKNNRGSRVDENGLSSELMQARAALQEVSKDEHAGAFAEIAAWSFVRAETGNREPWGLYWCPMVKGVKGDGQAFYTPDVSQLNDEIIIHWMHRSEHAQHPLIKARYADLVWEIGKYLGRAPENRPECGAAKSNVAVPVELPRVAIDGYVDTVENNLFDDEYTAWHLLSRAATLATRLNDEARKARVKEVLFHYFSKRDAEQRKEGHMMWWRLHDIVGRSERALNLNDAERAIVTQSLREALDRHTNIDGPHFNPHQADNAADRLARWTKAGREDSQQYTLLAGRAFEQAAEKADGMVAISWLEDLIPRYRDANLRDDQIRVENVIRARSAQTHSEMAQFSVPLGIKKDELHAWADDIAGNTMVEGLGRLANAALIRRDDIEKRIVAAKEHAPLAAWFPVQIKGADGFTEATIDSTDKDMEGRSYWTVAEHFGIDCIFSHAAFQRIHEKHGINLDTLMAMLMESPYFKEENEFMLREGLSAWIAGDPIKAIHLLVPQVEAACREVLIAEGQSVRRPFERVNGSKVIGFGEVLDRDLFQVGRLKDIGFHLRALYTEPRGLNLRNKLAHGMAQGETLNMMVAEMVIHSILMIAILVAPEIKGDEPGRHA